MNNDTTQLLVLLVTSFLVIRTLYYFSDQIQETLFGGTNCNPKG
jgi:hypothetical protein